MRWKHQSTFSRAARTGRRSSTTHVYGCELRASRFRRRRRCGSVRVLAIPMGSWSFSVSTTRLDDPSEKFLIVQRCGELRVKESVEKAPAKPTLQSLLRLAIADAIAFLSQTQTEPLPSDGQQSPRTDSAPTTRTQARRPEASAGNDRSGNSQTCASGAREPAAGFLEKRQAGQTGCPAIAKRVVDDGRFESGPRLQFNSNERRHFRAAADPRPLPTSVQNSPSHQTTALRPFQRPCDDGSPAGANKIDELGAGLIRAAAPASD